VAITGGVAEGKSTVLEYLREAGYEVESSDRLAREVFQQDEVQASIARILGVSAPVRPELLRSELGRDSVRRAVNELTHPLILEALQLSKAAFFEVPLLIEACLQGYVDRVWVVTCGPEEQLRRLAERLGGTEAAEALIRTQLTSRVKMPFADRVIRTNRDERSVQRFVTESAQSDLC
jgi:dephospho-CoA kinase